MRKKERSINTVLVAARDRMIYLLGRNIEGNSPEINTPEVINAGDDKKYSRTLKISRCSISRLVSTDLGSPLLQPAEPEDDGPLVLLDHLRHVIKLNQLSYNIKCRTSIRIFLIKY